MEFLIASAVLELRDSVEVISLSGSPLAKDTAAMADVAGDDSGSECAGTDSGRRGEGTGTRVRLPVAGNL